MSLVRAGLVVLLWGGTVPAALVALAHPAQAQDGGGESENADADDADEEPTEEEIRARRAAPVAPPAPAVDFSQITIEVPSPAQQNLVITHSTTR